MRYQSAAALEMAVKAAAVRFLVYLCGIPDSPRQAPTIFPVTAPVESLSHPSQNSPLPRC